MIERFFEKPYLLSRIKANSFGPSIEQFAAYLSERGYAFHLSKIYLRAAIHFSYWLRIKNISLHNVDEKTKDKFLFRHLKKCSCPIAKGSSLHCCRPALKHFLAMLRNNHFVAPASKSFPPVSPAKKIMQDFAAHIEKIRGLKLSTIHLYIKYIRLFLKTKFGDGPLCFHKLDNTNIKEYVSAKAKIYKPSTMISLTASLKAFFHFLRMTHLIEHSLEDAVPRVAQRRLSNIPQYLTEEQLECLLSSFDLSTANGIRDRAMALLMARLGLRSCEVSQLELEDINWRQSIIKIKKSKSRQTYSLPLTKEVGKALVTYIKKRRSHIRERRIFLNHTLPAAGRPLPAAAIGDVIRRVSKRCGLSPPRYGSHILRHTLATHLLQKGATLKQISDILRHQSIETTNIYAKVNLSQLVQVALPWPEEIS